MTKATKQSIIIADADNDLEIGANIPGNIVKVLVKEGEAVKASQPIAVIEAMKMETNIISSMDGTIDKIYVKQGDQVVSGQLIAKLVEEEKKEDEIL
jgi:pyruvate carboxylase